MTLSFTRLSWLWRKRKDKEQVSDNSSSNPSSGKRFNDDGNTKSKIKGKSREDRIKIIDEEYDMCLSGSESNGSDWSIGWSEPHAAGFMSSDDKAEAEEDDSFAVLVPCYRHDCGELQENVKNLPSDDSSGGKDYMERWLASLKNL